jgi:hypothetical protein
MLSTETQWQVISAMSYALPIVLTVIVMLLAHPRNMWLRGGAGIVLAWVASVAFTIWFYNPVARAHAEATLGAEYAFNRFDNNTVASTMLGGWIVPVITVLVFVRGRLMWRRVFMRAQ